MKITLLATFLFLVGYAQASCTSGDGPCQAGSGNCSTSVITALTGGDLSQAAAALSYGKYCGRFAQCQVVTNANASNPNQCESGSDGCPATPCDVLDAACQTHDSCLDTLIAENQIPAGQLVPIPERCECDVKLVAATFSIGKAGQSNVSLCDAAFYNTTLPGIGRTPIDLLTSEAYLVGIPSCCVVLATNPSTGEYLCGQDAVDKGYEDVFTVANTTCTSVVAGFLSQGINLCGASPPPSPPTSSPAAPTSSPGGSSAASLISLLFSSVFVHFSMLYGLL